MKYCYLDIVSKKVIITLLCSVAFFGCFAQYFPGPAPVAAEREGELLQELGRVHTDRERMRVLLDLGNCYGNKPLKLSSDLDKAVAYGRQAGELSLGLHDPAGYNEAQYLVSAAFMDQDKMQEAEAILPGVDDTTRVGLLLRLSFRYGNRASGQQDRNNDSSLLFAKEARILASRLNQPLNVATGMRYMGLARVAQGDDVRGEQELMEGFNESRRLGCAKMQYPYFDLVQYYYHMGAADSALAALLQVFHFMRLNGDSTDAGDFYYYFSMLMNADAQHQNALLYARLAFEKYKEHVGQGVIDLPMREVMEMLISLHDYRGALSFLLENYTKYPASDAFYEQARMGNIGDCYLKLKQYDKAEPYYLAEFNIHKATHSLGEHSYHRMGFFYIESKRYSEAKPYLLAALKLENSIPILQKNHLHYMLFLADSAAGDYIEAIRNLSLTKRYDDTVYEEKKVYDLQRLMVQYETKNKNEQIELLRQKTLLQEAHLKQANFLRDVTIVGIVLLLAAGFIFYRFYRQKQRNSELIARKNRQLERLLVEKEWLLKEVHHRVKNNLHTVISLLDIQAEFLEADAYKAIATSQRRIYAMSLIHQKLYLSDDIKTVDMADYLHDLVNYLKDSFETRGLIHYSLGIEPLHLDVSQAVPLGLIIHEAITNSIKYAFPAGGGGLIALKIAATGAAVTVVISDNGVGFSSEASAGGPTSLGLKLIRGLSEDIDARLEIASGEGTRITLVFAPGQPANAERDRTSLYSL
jgi:two-component sensor histidine kinase